MRQSGNAVSPMSNEGRNSYVTSHLTDALLALLGQKPIDEISISELTSKAGVGRASFYRNYASKEDILKRRLAVLTREWKDVWDKSEDTPLSEKVRIMIAHFERHRSFYALLNGQGLTYLLKDAIMDVCDPKPEYDATQAYASAFATYALYGWIDTWFARGMKESSDEMAELFESQGL